MSGPARYDTIGRGYDTTRRAEPRIADRLFALLDVPVGSHVLDLGCGTGNYTAALATRGLHMTGVDIAETMLTAARAKHPSIEWRQHAAHELPATLGPFDGATCVLAIHHFDDLAASFAAVRRVLRGGRFAIFTSSREQIRRYWLCEYFPEMLERSIEQMPDIDTVSAALESVGFASPRFEPFAVMPDIVEGFFYAGKYDPQRYLDPRVRAGISVFSLFASPAEVAQGCERLAADVESGRFEEVRRRYEHDGGDYGFVVADVA